ncbi:MULTISPECIES: FAD-dependent oxidoreductase [unclassified Bradyrhizobium]|uniref:FAD-dependent oxidoreductase n=1 Tax=unclassified Bradyrhizobium TaxID=2631580 RepID=UPI001FE05D48|nr:MULTISPECIES: FAD-dependent oxidoreductase [unclassified Bradyrhizobium]
MSEATNVDHTAPACHAGAEFFDSSFDARRIVRAETMRVVICAGVIGACIAWFLLRRGIDVIVV